MANEQIEQNAKEYAKKHYDIPFEDDSSMNVIVSEESYIAGAHSRDEEIKELKWKLAEKSGEVVNAIVDKVLLKQKLDKLRNPWISVKNRLPEKIKNKGVSKYVFVTWPDGTRGEAYYNYEEYKAPRWEVKGAGVSSPVVWMPIPNIY